MKSECRHPYTASYCVDCGLRVKAAEAERAVVDAARTYVEFIEATQAAPLVSAGLTPTYASNLSRLRHAVAALRAQKATPEHSKA